jgi:AcrR family transcriptional regulator
MYTVGEVLDRRARKKAQTRAEIRAVAQRLFAARGFEAVTISDIAREADVAVQTVFNHFATKEELFFDGRTPWVTGAAEAVRTRADGVPPLRALGEYLVDRIAGLAGSDASDERRSYTATLEASPALRAYELELVVEAERRLTEALAEAWSAPAATDDGAVVPTDPGTVAPLVAATWLAASRVLLSRQRPLLEKGAEARRSAEHIETMAQRIFRELERGLGTLNAALSRPAETVTGWPDERRAG